MKILFLGDSITDMCRVRDQDYKYPMSFGFGYPFIVNSKFSEQNPNEHSYVNVGISGNRIVDLYARVKADVWNYNPDVISILIGINDIWHEINWQNGVELERFIKVYDMLISDTLKVLPNVKIILCEPFVLQGTATEENYESFLQVKEYAKAIKGLAEKYSLEFLPLQDAFDKAAEKTQASDYLYDGVHPDIAGARLIADEWMKLYNEKIKKD